MVLGICNNYGHHCKSRGQEIGQKSAGPGCCRQASLLQIESSSGRLRCRGDGFQPLKNQLPSLAQIFFVAEFVLRSQINMKRGDQFRYVMSLSCLILKVGLPKSISFG